MESCSRFLCDARALNGYYRAMVNLSARNRYRLRMGSTFRLSLDENVQLRIATTNGSLPVPDDPDASPLVQTMTADADGIAIALTDAGQYYLDFRESSTDDVWCPAGAIDVLPLIDTREQTMRDELKFLTDRISKLESTHHTVSGADGTSLQRTDLPSLRRQRANAESRLGDLLRRRRGLPAARLRA